MALVWWISLTGSPPGAALLQWSDKAMHALAYAVLTLWFLPLWPRSTPAWRLVVIFVAMGVVLEALQSLTGIRHPDPFDAIANACGAVVAALFSVTRWRAWLVQSPHTAP